MEARITDLVSNSFLDVSILPGMEVVVLRITSDKHTLSLKTVDDTYPNSILSILEI